MVQVEFQFIIEISSTLSIDSGAVGFQASGRCLHNTRIFSLVSPIEDWGPLHCGPLSFPKFNHLFQTDLVCEGMYVLSAGSYVFH